MDDTHELVISGPFPYFSTVGGIYTAVCSCGTWTGDKDSERSLRKRHAEHASAKTKNEQQRDNNGR